MTFSACDPAPKKESTNQSAFIKIEGQNLMAPDGQKFFIQGINLGNWLNPEGYMFGFNK
ncbi:MAG: glycoside hydrolase family 5 protein, partial [Bacteroidota bacterium]|nr:glycoside hydrolase family 5 protein [Bacteroidota bacterium]